MPAEKSGPPRVSAADYLAETEPTQPAAPPEVLDWKALVDEHGPLALIVADEDGRAVRLYQLGGGVVTLVSPPVVVELTLTTAP